VPLPFFHVCLPSFLCISLSRPLNVPLASLRRDGRTQIAIGGECCIQSLSADPPLVSAARTGQTRTPITAWPPAVHWGRRSAGTGYTASPSARSATCTKTASEGSSSAFSALARIRIKRSMLWSIVFVRDFKYLCATKCEGYLTRFSGHRAERLQVSCYAIRVL
jgi:hypothetical protein